MAALKKGAKGKPVETLQTRLNKLGAKPKLKVDGIFGPITHKAVVAFQKKAKLKPTDGAVGKRTEAALVIGGPLPVMDVPDWTGKSDLAKELKKHNLLLHGYMLALAGATDIVDKVLDKKLPAATSMVNNNFPLWDDIVKKSKDMDKKQKDFKAILLSDPIKAKKLSEECDTLYDAIGTTGDTVGDNIDKVYDTLDETVKELSKGVGDIQKMMDNLKKHVKKGHKYF